MCKKHKKHDYFCDDCIHEIMSGMEEVYNEEVKKQGLKDLEEKTKGTIINK